MKPKPEMVCPNRCQERAKKAGKFYPSMRLMRRSQPDLDTVVYEYLCLGCHSVWKVFYRKAEVVRDEKKSEKAHREIEDFRKDIEYIKRTVRETGKFPTDSKYYAPLGGGQGGSPK